MQSDWPEDLDVRNFFDWLIQFVGLPSWDAKKAKVEDYLRSSYNMDGPIPLSEPRARLLYPFDKFFWYLYLIDSYLTHPLDYEFTQGARIIPLVKSLGRDISILDSIGGVEDRILNTLKSANNDPDSLIFEMIVAVAYAKVGWSNVCFVPESNSHKTPDIYCEKNGKGLYVECKRLRKSSAYAEKERLRWLEMWKPLKDYLAEAGKSWIFNITFRCELLGLSTDFLAEELVGKLRFVTSPGVLVDNEKCLIAVSFVDHDAIKDEFLKGDIKLPSSRLVQVITGDYRNGYGFTNILMAKKSMLHWSYISGIDFVAGSIWKCVSEKAIKSKARGILRQVSEATSQIPDGKSGVVNVGLESHDGNTVDQVRYDKIYDSLRTFDPRGKDIKAIYCHVFHPEVPPDRNWSFRETILPFVLEGTNEPPLGSQGLVDLDSAVGTEGESWEEPFPFS